MAGRETRTHRRTPWRRAIVALALGCAAPIPALAPVPALAQQQPMTITLAGQSMIRGDIRADAPEAIPAIRGLVTGDAAFTNFEAAVYDRTKGETTRDGRFASPPEAMEALTAVGFDMLSLANNHAFDLKAAGITNTLDTAQRLGVTHGGTGRRIDEADRPGLLTTPKGKIAFIAIASGLIGEGRATPTRLGVNELRVANGTPDADDVRRLLARVRAARQVADIVVVSQHNHLYPGVERPADFTQILLSELPARLAPPDWLKGWAHQLVDAGADVLAFHGPPFLHGVEVYRGKPIFYSLGNFIFQVPPESIHLEEPIMWESVVADVDFHRGRLTAVRFRPIALNKIGKGLSNPHDMYDINDYVRTRGLPRPATGAQAHHLLERLAAFSRPFGTQVRITGDTARIDLPPPR